MVARGIGAVTCLVFISQILALSQPCSSAKVFIISLLSPVIYSQTARAVEFMESLNLHWRLSKYTTHAQVGEDVVDDEGGGGKLGCLVTWL